MVAEVQENTFQESASGSTALTQLAPRVYAPVFYQGLWTKDDSAHDVIFKVPKAADLIDGGAAFEKVCQAAISKSDLAFSTISLCVLGSPDSWQDPRGI